MAFKVLYGPLSACLSSLISCHYLLFNHNALNILISCQLRCSLPGIPVTLLFSSWNPSSCLHSLLGWLLLTFETSAEITPPQIKLSRPLSPAGDPSPQARILYYCAQFIFFLAVMKICNSLIYSFVFLFVIGFSIRKEYSVYNTYEWDLLWNILSLDFC